MSLIYHPSFYLPPISVRTSVLCEWIYSHLRHHFFFLSFLRHVQQYYQIHYFLLVGIYLIPFQRYFQHLYHYLVMSLLNLTNTRRLYILTIPIYNISILPANKICSDTLFKNAFLNSISHILKIHV